MLRAIQKHKPTMTEKDITSNNDRQLCRAIYRELNKTSVWSNALPSCAACARS
jgi:hypothetical protein